MSTVARDWQLLCSAVGSGRLPVPVDRLLRVLAEVLHRELRGMGVDKPLGAAEIHLKVASRYRPGTTAFAVEIGHARPLLADAASHLRGVAACKALVGCALCCNVLGDRPNCRGYFKAAVELLVYERRRHRQFMGPLGRSAGYFLMWSLNIAIWSALVGFALRPDVNGAFWISAAALGCSGLLIVRMFRQERELRIVTSGLAPFLLDS